MCLFLCLFLIIIIIIIIIIIHICFLFFFFFDVFFMSSILSLLFVWYWRQYTKIKNKSFSFNIMLLLLDFVNSFIWLSSYVYVTLHLIYKFDPSYLSRRDCLCTKWITFLTIIIHNNNNNNTNADSIDFSSINDICIFCSFYIRFHFILFHFISFHFIECIYIWQKNKLKLSNNKHILVRHIHTLTCTIENT